MKKQIVIWHYNFRNMSGTSYPKGHMSGTSYQR
jgi:hypothetical protein